jgi:hypothetical protein
MSRARLRHHLRAALCLAASAWATPAIPQAAQVDLALVLAIDCSFSVDAGEFRLQMQGLGQALQDPAIMEAIQNGANQRIAIAAFQWSDADNQRVILPWTILSTSAEVVAVGKKLETMPRQLAEGGTSIGNALYFAQGLFASAPASERNVIDVSTDGRNNIGPPLPPIRDNVVAGGIVINALAITNEFPTLDIYAENQLVGGPGNFVIKANSYDDYGAAILRKLLKEIAGPGIT